MDGRDGSAGRDAAARADPISLAEAPKFDETKKCTKKRAAIKSDEKTIRSRLARKAASGAIATDPRARTYE